jgi:SAM-dependent methyltransferase
MWEQDRADAQERYRDRWRQHGYHPSTLGWNKDCQWVRFEAALEGLREEDFGSVLDVGCGFGDFLLYLRARGWKGKYVGVDLVPEFVAEAAARHAGDPQAEFVYDDGTNYSPAEPCDLAIAIGVFNHRVQQGNLEFVQSAMERMWACSRRVMVCDFLSMSSDPERRQSHLYYADPQQILALAAARSRRVMVHHAYMPFEFQVKIWHDDSFTVPQPVFPPYAGLASRQTELLDQTRTGNGQ